MIIRCPNCSTTYKVDGSVLDAPKPSFRCSRCKHVFSVHVRLQLDEEAPDALPEATHTPETDPDRVPDAPDMPSGAPADAAHETAADPQPVEGDLFPGAGDEEAREDDGVEGVDDVPATWTTEETPPAPPGDPPTQSYREDSENLEADDKRPDAELPYPEFDPDTAEARLLDDPHTLAFEQEGGFKEEDTGGDRPRPDFEIDDDFLIPPKREAPAPPLPDAKGSVVPFVSLIGLTLFAVGLATLIYMINPRPLDSLLRWIPWYGSAVFDSKHYKSTVVFESLVSGVRPVLNQTEVFVVSGKLVNRNDQSIRQVQIEAQLFDAEGKQVGRQVTFVGNAISAKIIADMSLREISLLQSLRPQSAYHIPPNGSADFTIVFPKPKEAVASFSCRVLAADGAA